MLKIICKEYRDNIKIRKFTVIYALICYLRVPHFRVAVLIRKMQLSKNKHFKMHMAKKLCIKYGVEVGRNAKIGEKLIIKHISGIVIGENASIGNNVNLYHNVTIGQKNGAYPTIEDNVTIYPGATILGDVVVNENAIILANSVVLESVPKNSIVGGTPAKVLKTSM